MAGTPDAPARLAPPRRTETTREASERRAQMFTQASYDEPRILVRSEA